MVVMTKSTKSKGLKNIFIELKWRSRKWRKAERKEPQRFCIYQDQIHRGLWVGFPGLFRFEMRHGVI